MSGSCQGIANRNIGHAISTVSQLRTSSDRMCCHTGCRLRELRGVEAERAGVEDQVREAVGQVGADDAVGVADRHQRAEPGHEGLAAHVDAGQEGDGAQPDRNHPA